MQSWYQNQFDNFSIARMEIRKELGTFEQKELNSPMHSIPSDPLKCNSDMKWQSANLPHNPHLYPTTLAHPPAPHACPSTHLPPTQHPTHHPPPTPTTHHLDSPIYSPTTHPTSHPPPATHHPPPTTLTRHPPSTQIDVLHFLVCNNPKYLKNICVAFWRS